MSKRSPLTIMADGAAESMNKILAREATYSCAKCSVGIAYVCVSLARHMCNFHSNANRPLSPLTN